MKQYNVRYSPQAVEDLQSIYNYIAIDLFAPMTANKLICKIQKQVKELKEMPYRFSKFEGEVLTEFEIHKAIVDNYLIIYLVEDNSKTVVILRVVYAGMNIQVMLKHLS